MINFIKSNLLLCCHMIYYSHCLHYALHHQTSKLWCNVGDQVNEIDGLHNRKYESKLIYTK